MSVNKDNKKKFLDSVSERLTSLFRRNRTADKDETPTDAEDVAAKTETVAAKTKTVAAESTLYCPEQGTSPTSTFGKESKHDAADNDESHISIDTEKAGNTQPVNPNKNRRTASRRSVSDYQLAKMEKTARALRDYVRDHISDYDLDIKKLAEGMGISRTKLFNIVYDAFETTPNEYILQQRMDHAKQLLMQGVKASKVARQCGYKDPKYFGKCFKRLIGVLPSHYRDSVENDTNDNK